MKSIQNNEMRNLFETYTYSKRRTKTNRLIKRNSAHRLLKIETFINEAASADLLPNFAITIVWHALRTAGDQREGHILGMLPHRRQQHLIRKIRALAKHSGFSTVYIWVSCVGAKMGDHLHMAVHWRHSSFLRLVELFQNILGSDVDHECEVKSDFEARSYCRGWEIKEIEYGFYGAMRWGNYMAYQKFKHQDTSPGRRMGYSKIFNCQTYRKPNVN